MPETQFYVLKSPLQNYISIKNPNSFLAHFHLYKTILSIFMYVFQCTRSTIEIPLETDCHYVVMMEKERNTNFL
jgi:hypothetical protein